MKFNLDWGVFESLFNNESAVEDVEADYVIPGLGSFNLKFFDATFFVHGISFFRPFIRGFIVLLLLIYNIHHGLKLFGGDSGASSEGSASGSGGKAK